MSELFAVQVLTHRVLCDYEPSRLFGAAFLRLAQKAKLKNLSGLKHDPQAYWAALVEQLRGMDARAASREIPSDARLLPAWQDLRKLALHVAHPQESPAPSGALVTLEVRTVHPDACFPDPNRLGPGKTDLVKTFVFRLLSDGSRENEIRTRYGERLQNSRLRIRAEDLWDFKMARPTRVPSPATGLRTTIEVFNDEALLAHLQPGAEFTSAAFGG